MLHRNRRTLAKTAMGLRDSLTMPVSLPVSPQLRTYSYTALTDGMCHNRKSRPPTLVMLRIYLRPNAPIRAT